MSTRAGETLAAMAPVSEVLPLLPDPLLPDPLLLPGSEPNGDCPEEPPPPSEPNGDWPKSPPEPNGDCPEDEPFGFDEPEPELPELPELLELPGEVVLPW